MYLYRALNKYNLKEYEATGEISARSNNAGNTFLSKVIDHVAKGSNGLKDDCWLSATKLFYICAEEYSIPQTGNYNTAELRKSIAVIDTNYWTDLTASYNESWTCLCEGKKPIVNYMDKSQFPPAVKTQTGRRGINGEQLTQKKTRADVQRVRDLINNNKIDGGLFDCSLPTESDVKHLCAIQELALFNMASTSPDGEEGKKNHRYGLLGEEKSISAIASGIAKNSDEVLILNKIPKEAIVAILSPLEIELLSVVDNAYFNQAIQDIKDKKISITLAPSELVVSRKNVASKTFPINSSVHTALEKTCVDAAYGEYSANPKLDFSKCFENIKTAKDKIIDGAVNYLNWSIDVNKKHLGHSLRVLDITESLKKEVTAIKKIDEADIYDILAIKLGNEVFMYNNIDLIKEFGLNK